MLAHAFEGRVPKEALQRCMNLDAKSEQGRHVAKVSLLLKKWNPREVTTHRDPPTWGFMIQSLRDYFPQMPLFVHTVYLPCPGVYDQWGCFRNFCTFWVGILYQTRFMVFFFISVCGLSFGFLNKFFHRRKVLNFIKFTLFSFLLFSSLNFMPTTIPDY